MQKGHPHGHVPAVGGRWQFLSGQTHHGGGGSQEGQEENCRAREGAWRCSHRFKEARKTAVLSRTRADGSRQLLPPPAANQTTRLAVAQREHVLQLTVQSCAQRGHCRSRIPECWCGDGAFPVSSCQWSQLVSRQTARRGCQAVSSLSHYKHCFTISAI